MFIPQKTIEYEITLKPGLWRTFCTILKRLLNVGRYSISLVADIPFQEIIFVDNNVLSFSIKATESKVGPYPSQAWRGLLCPCAVNWSDWDRVAVGEE